MYTSIFLLAASKGNPRTALRRLRLRPVRTSAMDGEDAFRNNRIEDVAWRCSLSESELDMLISLKKLVIQRAKVIGRSDLATKVDLKMLHALGFILMEYCKVKMIEQGLPDSAAFLGNCKLLDTSLNGDPDIQELLACLTKDSRKRKEESYV